MCFPPLPAVCRIDGTWGFSQVDLHDGDETGVKVIRLGFFAVEHLHRVGPSRDGEDGRFVEVLGELDGIQRG